MLGQSRLSSSVPEESHGPLCPFQTWQQSSSPSYLASCSWSFVPNFPQKFLNFVVCSQGKTQENKVIPNFAKGLASILEEQQSFPFLLAPAAGTQTPIPPRAVPWDWELLQDQPCWENQCGGGVCWTGFQIPPSPEFGQNCKTPPGASAGWVGEQQVWAEVWECSKDITVSSGAAPELQSGKSDTAQWGLAAPCISRVSTWLFRGARLKWVVTSAPALGLSLPAGML